MTIRIEVVHNPIVQKKTERQLARDTEGIFDGDSDAEILTLHYSELVVIDGDLEQFARAVWGAVFGTLPTPSQQEQPNTTQLDPLTPIPGEPEVSWVINADEGTSPAEAARNIWQRNFRRGYTQPSDGEACVFTVAADGGAVEIDLSEQRYAHLFEH